MRVIAGTCRSIPLKTVEGSATRPTTDRIKETLFNIIQNDIVDCRFLDLYAGSGQIAIEALSRGAKHAIMVEHDKKCAQAIRDNLHKTKLEEKATLMERELPAALKLLTSEGPFDLVFMDPPYDLHPEEEVLKELKENNLLTPESLVIIEAAKDRDCDFIEGSGFELVRTKVYKNNMHLFLRPVVEGSAS
ncbi:16S rRNA (guanine966-N2)-methyltransferase [Lachnospiraceae bacterium C10]|jgi:16S rRNA (guanine966-N2)-methyltransferase|nr:16S rRNA (guanine(966)-N(2))-methyltransferase RsmD [Lachnospiraceae bacterium]SCW27305.1 16S rRNA (guanine966-N2)-methyltransferase [Lachnospiraceae bacterium C10]SDW02967.1 16S rRNA (guanine966-N2)-methyltransferase [Lachnospiraceae bacterium KHCPX20]